MSRVSLAAPGAAVEGGSRGMSAASAALAAMTVSFGLNFSAGVFFAPAVDEYGIDGATLAIAAALSTLLTGVVQPFVGVLLDRVGATRVLLTGLTLMAASYLTLAVVTVAWQFVFAYAILGGLGFAASSSLTVSTLIGRVYGGKAGTALARAAVGINLGQLLVPWAATVLFEPAGIRGTYAIVGAGALGVTVLLAPLLPRGALPARVPRRESLRGQTSLLASFGLHAATMYVVVLMLPKHATELGWTVTDAGRLVAVAAVAAGLTSVALSRLLRRHRPESLLCLLHVLRAAALALLALGSGGAALLTAAVLFGVSSFPVIPLTMTIMSRGLDPSRMGRTLAPAWVTHQAAAASGLGLAVAVHTFTGGYREFFAVGSVFALTAFLLITPITKENNHEFSKA